MVCVCVCVRVRVRVRVCVRVRVSHRCSSLPADACHTVCECNGCTSPPC